MTHSAEHYNENYVRATEDDTPSESKRKIDKSAISEMKMPSCGEITHLLKTVGKTAELTSASRQVAYSKMTHKLRVKYSNVIIRIIAGSCSHAITLILQ